MPPEIDIPCEQCPPFNFSHCRSCDAIIYRYLGKYPCPAMELMEYGDDLGIAQQWTSFKKGTCGPVDDTCRRMYRQWFCYPRLPTCYHHLNDGEWGYMCGIRDWPSMMATVHYPSGCGGFRLSSLSTCNPSCPYEDSLCGDPWTPPDCMYGTPNSVLTGISYTSIIGETLSNWIPPIPGTLISWCIGEISVPCEGINLSWTTLVDPEKHINNANIFGVLGPGLVGTSFADKDTYGIQPYGSTNPRAGLSEFNGPFYRTLSTYNNYTVAIGGITPDIRLSSHKDPYISTDITNPFQVAQGLSYAAVIGDQLDWTLAMGLTFIEFIKKSDKQIVDIPIFANTTHIPKYTYVSGNKEDATPIVTIRAASAGVSMNGCNTPDPDPGCVCNTGNPYCNASDCELCVQVLNLHSGDQCTSWTTECRDLAAQVWAGTLGVNYPVGHPSEGDLIPAGVVCGSTGPEIYGATVGQYGDDVFAAIYDRGFNYWSMNDTSNGMHGGGIFGNRPDLLIKKVLNGLLPTAVASSSGYTLCCGFSFSCEYPEPAIFYDKISVGTKHSVVTAGIKNPNADIYTRKETPYLIQFSGGTFAQINASTTWSTRNLNNASAISNVRITFSPGQYNGFLNNPKYILNTLYGTLDGSTTDIDTLWLVGITAPSGWTYQYDLNETLCNSYGHFINGACEFSGTTMCHPIQKHFGSLSHPVWNYGTTYMDGTSVKSALPTINLINADELCTQMDSKYTNGSWDWVSAGGEGESCSVLRCYGNPSVSKIALWGGPSWSPLASNVVFTSNFHKTVAVMNSVACIYTINSNGRILYPSSCSGFTFDDTLTYTDISSGDYHVCAVTSGGSVKCIRYSTIDQSNTLVIPLGITMARRVACGNEHTLALNDDGTITAWGSNTNGECDVPVNTDRYISISAGDKFSAAITTTGAVVVWGDNNYDQHTIPQSASSDCVQISCGDGHICALKNDGTVVCWGRNIEEQSLQTGAAGVPTPIGKTYPTDLTNVKYIAAASFFSCAVRDDNTIAYWGSPEQADDYPNVALGKSITQIEASQRGFGGVVILHETIADPPSDDRFFMCWGGRFDTNITSYPDGLWPFDTSTDSALSPIIDVYSSNEVEKNITNIYAPCQIDLTPGGSPLFYYKTAPYSVYGTKSSTFMSLNVNYVLSNTLGKIKYYDSKESTWKNKNGYGDSTGNIDIDNTINYKTFIGQNSLFNSSGDWTPTYPIIGHDNTWITNRYTTEPLCGPPVVPTGACCTDETCVIKTADECKGIYKGDGISCTPDLCIIPDGCCEEFTGPCCYFNNTTCNDITPSECDNTGGVFIGFGRDCSECPP